MNLFVTVTHWVHCYFVVSQALRENTYPFLALVVLRDNKMTVVARIEGPIGKLLSSYGQCFMEFRQRREVTQYDAKCVIYFQVQRI